MIKFQKVMHYVEKQQASIKDQKKQYNKHLKKKILVNNLQV